MIQIFRNERLVYHTLVFEIILTLTIVKKKDFTKRVNRNEPTRRC
jgi:hypothetical protein